MEQFDLEGIENIIFDLGMVIIDLEQDETIEGFKELFGKNYENFLGELNAKNHFEKYETGKISTDQFVAGIDQMLLHDESQAKEIKKIWNAMLKEIPNSRFEILEKAQKDYRTFCLSNTNELHIEYIYDYLRKEKNMNDLDRFFEKVYLSHEIRMRKPDREIFEFVIKENQLDPAKTMFIDDTAGHLKGAESCGIRSFHLSENIKLEDLFPL